MNRLVALAPELALVWTSVTLFAMMPGRRRRASGVVLVVGGIAALAAAIGTIGVSDEFLYLAYRVDAYSQVAKAIVMAGLVLASTARGATGHPEPAAEDQFFLAVAALGLVAAASLVDVLALFLALEITSVAMLALAGLGSLADGHRGWGRLTRTSLTPSALGALGLALLVGATGATRLADITSAVGADAAQPAAFAGAALFLCGFLVRWGAAPFYAWLPHLLRDPSPRVALFAGTSIWMGLGVVIVRLVAALAPLGHSLAVLLALVAVVAFLFGTFNLRPRRDARCLLSYLLVAQSGFVIAALATPGPRAVSAALAATLVVAAANAAILLVLTDSTARGPVTGPGDFRAIVGRSPFVAVPLVTGLLALAALPPTAGFLARWRLLDAAWREGWWAPALAGVAASTVLAFLAIALVRQLLVRGDSGRGAAAAPPPARVALMVAWALAILLLVLALAPGPLHRGADFLSHFVI